MDRHTSLLKHLKLEIGSASWECQCLAFTRSRNFLLFTPCMLFDLPTLNKPTYDY